MKKLLLLIVFCLLFTSCLTIYDMLDAVQKEIIRDLEIIDIYYNAEMNIYFWRIIYFDKKTFECSELEIMLCNSSSQIRRIVETGKYKLKATIFYNVATGQEQIYIAWIYTAFKRIRLKIKKVDEDPFRKQQENQEEKKGMDI